MNPDEVVYHGKYIWHRLKNERNKQEHGIGFEEAVDVFDDPFSVEEYDIENSIAEDRYNVTGTSGGKWIVVTVTMTPRGELIRIISARSADILGVCGASRNSMEKTRQKRVFYPANSPRSP